jgi:hypothetical protein
VLDLFILLLLSSPFLVVGFLIFSVVVGCVATAKNRSFLGWFLLSFLITPLFALLALIAVPMREPRPDPSALAWFAITAAVIGVVGAGFFWLIREPSPTPKPAASII